MFQDEIDHPGAGAWVVRLTPPIHHDDIGGYVCLRKVIDEIEVLRLAVHHDYQRQGVGRWLLEKSLGRFIDETTRLVTLEVRTSNQAALAFYAQAGFQLRAVRPNYYTVPREDAHILVKKIQEDP